MDKDLLKIDRFFTRQKGETNDKNFVESLKTYFYWRIIYLPWLRGEKLKNSIDNITSVEVEHYKETSNDELIKAIKIEQYYKWSWFENKTEFSGRARRTLQNLKSQEIREAGLRVIQKNNNIKIGDKFPSTKLLTFNLDSISISDIEADFIVVDFFAIWCSPCIDEMKNFSKYRKRYNEVKFISISVDSDIDKVKEFKNKRAFDWMFLFDGENGNLSETVSVNSLPTYFILDKEKRILSSSNSKDNFGIENELDVLIK